MLMIESFRARRFSAESGTWHWTLHLILVDGCGLTAIYNQSTLFRFRHISAIFFASCTLFISTAAAQESPQHLVLVLPFDNTGKTPGLDWMSEAFPETIGRRLTEEDALIINRSDRIYAFERMGIPGNSHPSRATILMSAKEMDVDLVVMGSFSFDGSQFTVHAQMLSVKSLRMTPEIVESGGIAQFMDIMDSIAWDLIHSNVMHGPVTGDNLTQKRAYIASKTSPRLDAYEKYIRGVSASGAKEKLLLLQEAVQFSQDFPEARLACGEVLYNAKEYSKSEEILKGIPDSSPLAGEAHFYSGLAQIFTGHFDRAEDSFASVVARLPLIEAVNNLGVAQARRGKKTAIEQFFKATEADSSDPDYHFNLAIAQWRNGSMQEATSQLKEALAIDSGFSDAKSLLDAIVNNQPLAHQPLERVKLNYDETSYRQLQLEIERAKLRKTARP